MQKKKHQWKMIFNSFHARQTYFPPKPNYNVLNRNLTTEVMSHSKVSMNNFHGLHRMQCHTIECSQNWIWIRRHKINQFTVSHMQMFNQKCYLFCRAVVWIGQPKVKIENLNWRASPTKSRPKSRKFCGYFRNFAIELELCAAYMANSIL